MPNFFNFFINFLEYLLWFLDENVDNSEQFSDRKRSASGSSLGVDYMEDFILGWNNYYATELLQ